MMTASTAAFRRSGVIRIASRGLPAGGSTNDRALVFHAGTGIQTDDVRITPEIRCLKWTVPRSPSSDDVAFYLRPPHDYEVQFLLGIGSSRK
jgi:hypothetical protein